MSLPRLMLISPGVLHATNALSFARRAEALRSSPAALLLREPSLHDAAYLRLALELRQRLPETPLVLHDRPHLVQRCEADGVHLGFRSLQPEVVREQCDGWIGLSTHAHDEREPWSHADYLFHGPVCHTPSKTDLVEPTGWTEFGAAARAIAEPVFALGGMLPEHAQPALEAGAQGLAVLGGVFGPDVEVEPALDAYLAALHEAVT